MDAHMTVVRKSMVHIEGRILRLICFILDMESVHMR
jgi:hypothetical protein